MTAYTPGIGSDQRLYLAEVAAILDELSHEIEALGETLCTNAAVVSQHLHELQAIDRIAQKQRSLTALLLADCMVSAAAEVRLDEVAERLRNLR